MAIFYVRPDTSHSGTRNGTSYATAWGGWSEITWSSLTSDSTLYVCGAHSYSSSPSVGTHGGTLGHPVTISFDYVTSPGTLAFTASNLFLFCTKPYTVIQNCTSIQSLVATGPATNSTYKNLAFSTSGDEVAFKLQGGTGDNHADVTIDGCSFTSTSNPTVSIVAAISWFVSTAALSTITRFTVKNCSFTNYVASRSVVHLRSQQDADVSTKVKDFIFDNNMFTGCAGNCFEANCSGPSNTYDNSSGVKVRNNKFTDCVQNSGNFGGAIFLSGFGLSQTNAFGNNDIHDNTVLRVTGDVGLADVLWGCYDMRKNSANTMSTNTIDGNVILFDTGCHDSVATRNFGTNITGKAGVANSGCGIMILDQCYNNYAYGNVFDGVNNGVFYGASGTLGNTNYIFNNLFLNVTLRAVYVGSTASAIATQIMQNCVFSGVGYKVNNASAYTWTSGEDYNHYYGFSTGNTSHTLGTHDYTYTLAADISRLLLDATTYRPAKTSPAIAGGVFVKYSKDYGGGDFNAIPPVGAQENRDISARRTATTRNTRH